MVLDLMVFFAIIPPSTRKSEELNKRTLDVTKVVFILTILTLMIR